MQAVWDAETALARITEQCQAVKMILESAKLDRDVAFNLYGTLCAEIGAQPAVDALGKKLVASIAPPAAPPAVPVTTSASVAVTESTTPPVSLGAPRPIDPRVQAQRKP